jgi:hypothetical protein
MVWLKDWIGKKCSRPYFGMGDFFCEITDGGFVNCAHFDLP